MQQRRIVLAGILNGLLDRGAIQATLILDDQANLPALASQCRKSPQQQVDAFVPEGTADVDKDGLVLTNTQIGTADRALPDRQWAEDGGIGTMRNDAYLLSGKPEFNDTFLRPSSRGYDAIVTTGKELIAAWFGRKIAFDKPEFGDHECQCPALVDIRAGWDGRRDSIDTVDVGVAGWWKSVDPLLCARGKACVVVDSVPKLIEERQVMMEQPEPAGLQKFQNLILVDQSVGVIDPSPSLDQQRCAVLDPSFEPGETGTITFENGWQ